MAGATYDVVSGIASNSTVYTTSASYGELHNISLATGDGITFLKASWEAQMNFTAPLYGRFMRDGMSLGRFNLTQSVYAQVGAYEMAFNETEGTHYYGFEVYSNKKGWIYSRNFSAVFLKNGSYGSGAGGAGNVSSVTGAPAGVLDASGTDDITLTLNPMGTNFRNDTISTQGTAIDALKVNDSYFNGSVFRNSTNFRNDSISGKLDTSTYSGNFPNSSLVNYLPISTYSGNFPNSSLINYLLISTYAGNFPNSSLPNYLLTSLFGSNFNTSFHTEIPVCNATTGKLVSDDGETVTCGTDQTGAAGGNVSSVIAQSPLTYTGTTDVVIKDERTTYPNSTVGSKEATWDTVTSKTTLTEVNSSAQITETQVTNLISDLAGKEPTITGSTSNTFWNGLKQWITLGIGNITGLQGLEDTQNSSIASLQSNDTQDRAFVNTTFMKVVNATICAGTDKNIWNGSWWNCAEDQNTGTSTGGGINVSGQPVITANASLVEGTNITLTQSGTNITVSSTMGFTTISTEQFTASGTEQNYTLSANYLVNSTRVYVNGLRQPLNFTAGSYTESVATKSINFTSSPRNGDKIEVEYAQS
jgi:hypothetical protein